MKPKKTRRASDLFISFCFLAFLFVGMAATLLRNSEEYSFFENRMLAAMPKYTPEGDGNGSYVNQLETYLSDHAALRNTLLKFKARADLALRRPVVNDVVVGDGILLPYLPAEQTDEADIAEQAVFMADNLKGISDLVSSCGGHYFYVHVPCQYACYPDRYPWFLNNREQISQLSVDCLTRELAARGVNFVDVSIDYWAEGRPEKFGSIGDDHYSMYGAFFAYQRVLEQVVERTGLDIPILRDEDVNIQPLANPYLGSRERKLLGLIDLEEPLYVLHPWEWVPFTRIDGGEESRSSVYALPYNPWDQLTYNLYMGGDLTESFIDTHRPELPSVLIYGDSFTNAMECVLYLSFDKMYSLDMRHYEGMSLTDYIQMVKPDVVLCVRDTYTLLDPSDNGGVADAGDESF